MHSRFGLSSPRALQRWSRKCRNPSGSLANYFLSACIGRPIQLYHVETRILQKKIHPWIDVVLILNYCTYDYHPALLSQNHTNDTHKNAQALSILIPHNTASYVNFTWYIMWFLKMEIFTNDNDNDNPEPLIFLPKYHRSGLSKKFFARIRRWEVWG